MIKKYGLSNNMLKIIAMIAMTVDHVAVQFFPFTVSLRIIGRLAFPIFAYMLAEGCTYTRHPLRHFLTLSGLGAVFQIVYIIAMGSWRMNIFITFALAVLTIFTIEGFLSRPGGISGLIVVLELAFVAFLCIIFPAITDNKFRIDYGIFGVLLPSVVYFLPNKWTKLLGTAVMLTLHAFTSSYIQFYALLTIPLLALYSGKRGRWNIKYLFYIFYPAHLVLIYFIALII